MIEFKAGMAVYSRRTRGVTSCNVGRLATIISTGAARLRYQYLGDDFVFDCTLGQARERFIPAVPQLDKQDLIPAAPTSALYYNWNNRRSLKLKSDTEGCITLRASTDMPISLTTATAKAMAADLLRMALAIERAEAAQAAHDTYDPDGDL